jgi:hypothetical protein
MSPDSILALSVLIIPPVALLIFSAYMFYRKPKSEPVAENPAIRADVEAAEDGFVERKPISIPSEPVPAPEPEPELTPEEQQEKVLKISATMDRITLSIDKYGITIDMYPAGAELLASRIQRAITAAHVMSGNAEAQPKRRDRTRVRSKGKKS